MLFILLLVFLFLVCYFFNILQWCCTTGNNLFQPLNITKACTTSSTTTLPAYLTTVPPQGGEESTTSSLPTCYDSDLGADEYFVDGYCIDNNGRIDDTCNSDTMLLEAYCNADNECHYHSEDCTTYGTDYECNNNRCEN